MLGTGVKVLDILEIAPEVSSTMRVLAERSLIGTYLYS